MFRVIDPVKLRARRADVDDLVAEVCLSETCTRPQGYVRLVHSLGYCMHVHANQNGWSSGYVHGTGEDPIDPIREPSEKLAEARALIASLSEKSANLDKPAMKRILGEISSKISDVDELVRSAPRRLIGRIGERLIFGVGPEAVASALALTILDADVDLFLDGRGFVDLYPEHEWEELFAAFPIASFTFGEATDADQMWLFPEIELSAEFGRDIRTTLTRLQKTGPLAVLGERE